MKSLIAALIEEELISQTFFYETDQQFIERICALCLDEIESAKGFAPYGFGRDVIEEIELEVKEVFRIKTYGHYNLNEYRKKIIKDRSY